MRRSAQTGSNVESLRREFHVGLFEHCVRMRSRDVPNMSDKDSRTSVKIALGMTNSLGISIRTDKVSPQRVGSKFAAEVHHFLERAFDCLLHLRPGEWAFSTAQGPEGIARFAQYAHLASIEKVLTKNPELRSALGGDYLIKPDIVVSRKPVSDADINKHARVVASGCPLARRSPLRAGNVPGDPSILHATVSVKWSMRSDRAQNTRTEALNVIRNRKGSTPRIVVVTMEPLPSRLASIAMGTGDIDCCYHAALEELLMAAKEVGLEGSEEEILRTLIDGERLRDISDLPFDLAT